MKSQRAPKQIAAIHVKAVGSKLPHPTAPQLLKGVTLPTSAPRMGVNLSSILRGLRIEKAPMAIAKAIKA